ncbi:hypothetical protein EI94DRAFT_1702557 [Lactarius quietus]|nr:hypothetical protein EI94DRAFT_1702557 [Lactarius quietus]
MPCAALAIAPVVQSLSLELHARRSGETSEAGRLFHAMSVIQSLGCVLEETLMLSYTDLDGVTYVCENQVIDHRQCPYSRGNVLSIGSGVALLFFPFPVQIPESKGKAAEEVEVQTPAATTAVLSVLGVALDDWEEAFVNIRQQMIESR